MFPKFVSIVLAEELLAQHVTSILKKENNNNNKKKKTHKKNPKFYLHSVQFFVTPWKVTDLTEKLEERMYQVYSHHSKIIQERLQEFTQKMAKISLLEMELKQVCHTVETVYKDLCVQSEVRVWGCILWGKRPGMTQLRVNMNRNQASPFPLHCWEWNPGHMPDKCSATDSHPNFRKQGCY